MDANKVVYQTATGDNSRGVYSNAGVKKLYPNYFKNEMICPLHALIL